MSDAFPTLPDIAPDPHLQLTTWEPSGTATSRAFNVKKRRAFLQNLVMQAPIGSVEEMREAVRRRFGVAPTIKIMLNDVKQLGLVRVPNKHGGFRYRVQSQLPDVNIEQEVDNRCRIDLLSVVKTDKMIHLEVNRGTAQAFVQLLNLLVDDAALPGVVSITSDMDKWIVLHVNDGHRAKIIAEMLQEKVY